MQLVKTAKYAFEMKNYTLCVVLIETFEKNNLGDELFELKLECFLHLKYFSQILNAKGSISENGPPG